MTYVWLDKFFDVHEMLTDIAKRRFITAGMTAFALMIPLALTSTKWSIRKLGGKRWQALHRLIYFSAAAGVIHYIWLVKADLRKPLEYACGAGRAAALSDARCGSTCGAKRNCGEVEAATELRFAERRICVAERTQNVRSKRARLLGPRPLICTTYVYCCFFRAGCCHH